MKGTLSVGSSLVIGSMLFGMFFGAGNLIFPVHMGQEAGSSLWTANLGFLVTAIGLPFLGIVAMGISESSGLFSLASRIHPTYSKIFTILLYLTIGPAFAIPRTATVSYQVGVAPFISEANQTMALAIFTFCFFAVAIALAMNPGKLMVWIGKVLNPIFLVFIAILGVVVVAHPMGNPMDFLPTGAYADHAFFKGFTEGYNTMDALAALAFGILVINSMKELGVTEPKEIAIGVIKSGIVVVVLMAIIYSELVYVGASSLGSMKLSANGGIALAQIADFYFGSMGGLFLALIVTVACLKTAIGLTTACSETFEGLFPNSVGYKTYVYIFAGVSFLVGNVGLTQIITLAIPVLMFLYPLTITLVLLTLISSTFGHRQEIYVSTTVCAAIAAFGDACAAVPESLQQTATIQNILSIYKQLPFFEVGMGWIVPTVIGFVAGLTYCMVVKKK